MLELGATSLCFEPDSGSVNASVATRNFFDKASLRICTVRNNGGLGLTCKSLYSSPLSTRTRDRGPVTLVKVSHNGRMAILQRNKSSVDVVVMSGKADQHSIASEFNIPSKSKEAIVSVEWLTNTSILLITTQTLEIFNINEDKLSAKYAKTLNISSSWVSFFSQSGLAVLASGPNSAILQPVLIQNGTFIKLKPFDVDHSSGNLLEKDVFIASLYGSMYVMVFRYGSRFNTNTELRLYELANDLVTPAKCRFVLVVGSGGGFGVHVRDNLVIVHHQPTCKSMIFDVGIALHRPCHTPLIVTSIFANNSCLPAPELYTVFWHMFLPNLVIDPVAGLMYDVVVRCDLAHEAIEDKGVLIEFLINRSVSSKLIISTLYEALTKRELKLKQIRKIFAMMADQYISAEQAEAKAQDQHLSVVAASARAVLHTFSNAINLLSTMNQLAPKVQFNVKPINFLKIEQQEIYSNVFLPLKEDPNVDKSFTATVMLSYFQSLTAAGIAAEAYFVDFLVESMAEADQLAKLSQLITYRVFPDSKPLAFQLLSYAARHPPLLQASVDILYRQHAFDEITEVLLHRGCIIDAVRYSDGHHYDGSTAKLLEAADKEDRQVSFAVRSQLSKRKSNLDENVLKNLYPEDDNAAAEDAVAKVYAFTDSYHA